MKPHHTHPPTAGRRSASLSRAVGAALIVVGGTAGLTATTTTSTAFTLASTTALITSYQGGLGPNQTTPAVKKYLGMAMDNYITPGMAPPTDGTYNRLALVNVTRSRNQTLDQITVENQAILDNCIRATTGCSYNSNVGSSAPAPGDSFVVFGYSESTGWATLEKRALAVAYPTAGTGPQVSFVLIGNLSRPNGGVSERNPPGSLVSLLKLTANGSTPTDTQYTTIDITRQYDGASDAPLNPNNFLANLNAKMGFALVHTDYASVGLQAGGGALEQDQYGDTTYYMIPTETLPLLMPLSALPGGKILADMLDPQLRVIVESAYDRTVSPGVPTPHDASYAPDPTAYAADLALAKLTGRDNLFEDLGLGRPNGTTRPDTSGQGAYGIGGPPVTMPQQTTTVPVSSPTTPDPVPTPDPVTTITQDDVTTAVVSTNEPRTNIVRTSFDASRKTSTPASASTTAAASTTSSISTTSSTKKSRPLATALADIKATVHDISASIRTSRQAKSAAAKAGATSKSD